MSYKHLSLTERYYIELQKKEGRSMNIIAQALGRSQSTISRELDRNTGQRGYRHKQADQLSQERHNDKPKAVKMTSSSRSGIILSRTGALSRLQAD